MFSRYAVGCCALLLCAFNVHAKSVRFTGQIEAFPVHPSFIDSGEVSASVDEYSVLPEANALGCQLTTDFALASSSSPGNVYCLFEWYDVTGYAIEDIGGLPQATILPTAGGIYSLNYRISYVEDPALDPIVLVDSAHSYVVNDVDAPTVERVYVKVGTSNILVDDRDDASLVPQQVVDPSDPLMGVRIEVQPRTYVQRVFLEGVTIGVAPGIYEPEQPTLVPETSYCDVAPGQTMCEALFDGFDHQSVDYQQLATGDELHIVSEFTFTVDSQIRGFGAVAQTADIVANMTPPSIPALVVNGQSEGATDLPVLSIAGHGDIPVPQDSALIQVQLPRHQSDFGWRRPNKITVQLTPVGEMQLEEQLVVDGRILLEVPPIELSDTVSIDTIDMDEYPSSEFNAAGGWLTDLVYAVDLSSVPMGNYEVSVIGQDELGHEIPAIDDHLTELTLLRTAPEMGVFQLLEPFTSGGENYFPEHLTVAAFNGVVNSVAITEVLWDGQPVSFSSPRAEVAQLSTNGLTLNRNDIVELQVTATTSNGEEFVQRVDVNYMPFGYKVTSEEILPVAAVQEQTLTFVQEFGANCTVTPDSEIAAGVATDSSFGCVITVDVLPPELTATIEGDRMVARGVVDAHGTHPIQYTVRMYDHLGHEALAFSGYEDWFVAEAQPPVLKETYVTVEGELQPIEPGENPDPQYSEFVLTDIADAIDGVTVTISPVGYDTEATLHWISRSEIPHIFYPEPIEIDSNLSCTIKAGEDSCELAFAPFNHNALDDRSLGEGNVANVTDTFSLSIDSVIGSVGEQAFIASLEGVFTGSGFFENTELSIVGTLRAVLPEPDFEENGEPLVGVRDYEVTPLLDAVGCHLTSSDSIAITSTEYRKECLFEWLVESPVTSVETGTINKASVLLSDAGESSFPYRVSYLSDLSAEPIELLQGTYEFTTEAPIDPVVTSVSATASGGPVMLNSPIEGQEAELLYNPNAQVSGLRVEVEARNYDQHVVLHDLNIMQIPGVFESEELPESNSVEQRCVVRAGQDYCNIQFDDFNHDVFDYDNFLSYGAEFSIDSVFSVAVDSGNEYFNANPFDNILHAYLIPPVALAAAANVANEELEVTIPVAEGIVVDVERNLAKVHVRTAPHDENFNWAAPDVIQLKLTPIEESRVIDGLFLVDDVEIYDLDIDVAEASQVVTLSSMGGKEEHLTSLSAPEYGYQREIIYTVDVTDVPEGMYSLEVVGEDGNGNRLPKVIAGVEEIAILRSGAVFDVLDNYQIMDTGDAFDFSEHMHVVAFNGVADSMRVDEVTIGDEVMPLEFINDGVYAFGEGAFDNLVPNSEYDITITASNINDQQFTKTIVGKYLPMSFQLSGMREENFNITQRHDITLLQDSGRRCYTAVDSEQAEYYANRSRPRCVYEFTTIPAGFVATPGYDRMMLSGYTEENGPHEFTYRVTMYDGEGHSVVLQESTESFSTIDPSAPEIVVNMTEEMEEGVGAIYAGTRYIGSAVAEFNVGEATFEATSSLGVTTSKGRQTSRGTSQRVGMRLAVPEGVLWDTFDIDLNAWYDKNPLIRRSKSVQGVYVPSKYVTMRANWSAITDMLNTETHTIEARLGQYSYQTKEMEYDAETMGQWEAMLVRIDRTEEEPLTTWTRVDENGQVEFDWTPGELVEAQQVKVLGRLVVPDGIAYSREIDSDRLYARVLKGEAIDGQVVGSRVVGRTPFSLTLSYRGLTQADTEALGHLSWQVSEDGISWSTASEFDNNSRFSHRFEERDIMFVRARMVNRHTGIVSTTESIEVLAYSTPSFNIDGPTRVFNDQLASYSLDLAEGIDPSDVIVQWSENDPNNFDFDGSEYNLELNESSRMTLYARARFSDMPEMDNVWFTRKLTISSQEPQPKSVFVSVPSLIRAGDTVELTAKMTQSGGIDLPIIYKWTLPDGSILGGETVTITTDPAWVVNSRIPITVEAWYDGFSASTSTSYTASLRTWVYEPQDLLLMSQVYYKYAPAKVKFSFIHDRPYMPGVTYSYEIIETPDITVISGHGTKAQTVSITQPGVYTVEGVLRDSEGGETRSTVFVEVLPEEELGTFTRMYYGNTKHREPMTLSARVSVSVPHPDDRLTSVRFYQDGVLKSDPETPITLTQSFGTLAAGVYEITMEIETLFGQTKTLTETVEVADNVRPICALKQVDYSTGLSMWADCDDVDGRMSFYQWEVDGEAQGTTTLRLSMMYSQYSGPVDVTVRAFDDSGEYTEMSQTVWFP
ncbi:hypothetical protein IC617_08110 [Neiella sp. HB171785]|uniref:Uncharacterized protein n=1 Tax=Neiella litorisoli TaxID=2771431 RepID=A0A8J6UPT0_9GAMM|nr:hypothetical protein [Neiella litorisoli]MBD1389387.1 hypothetical protein [Neiella litorisoli]